jgi:PTH1 family peptidyl-tRNA hydrolase
MALFAKRISGGAEWLLVCLGNYGQKYENTRHNIGFMAADRLVEQRDLRCNRLRFRSLTELIEFGGARVLLMKPQTYMNLSGEAVGEAARFYKIPPERVLVISDDVSLPLGRLRVRASGSAGGHNGLKSIIAHLGSDAFPRVKVGVGAPPNPEWDMADWVTGTFSASERKLVNDAVDRALQAAECVVSRGVPQAQNQFNG